MLHYPIPCTNVLVSPQVQSDAILNLQIIGSTVAGAAPSSGLHLQPPPSPCQAEQLLACLPALNAAAAWQLVLHARTHDLSLSTLLDLYRDTATDSSRLCAALPSTIAAQLHACLAEPASDSSSHDAVRQQLQERLLQQLQQASAPAVRVALCVPAAHDQPDRLRTLLQKEPPKACPQPGPRLSTQYAALDRQLHPRQPLQQPAWTLPDVQIAETTQADPAQAHPRLARSLCSLQQTAETRQAHPPRSLKRPVQGLSSLPMASSRQAGAPAALQPAARRAPALRAAWSGSPAVCTPRPGLQGRPAAAAPFAELSEHDLEDCAFIRLPSLSSSSGDTGPPSQQMPQRRMGRSARPPSDAPGTDTPRRPAPRLPALASSRGRAANICQPPASPADAFEFPDPGSQLDGFDDEDLFELQTPCQQQPSPVTSQDCASDPLDWPLGHGTQVQRDRSTYARPQQKRRRTSDTDLDALLMHAHTPQTLSPSPLQRRPALQRLSSTTPITGGFERFSMIPDPAALPRQKQRLLLSGLQSKLPQRQARKAGTVRGQNIHQQHQRRGPAAARTDLQGRSAPDSGGPPPAQLAPQGLSCRNIDELDRSPMLCTTPVAARGYKQVQPLLLDGFHLGANILKGVQKISKTKRRK